MRSALVSGEPVAAPGMHLRRGGRLPMAAGPVSPRVRRLRLAHPVYAELGRVFAADGDVSDSPEATYLCAAASAWAPAGPQALVDVMYRLGLGAAGVAVTLSAYNPALRIDTAAVFVRDGEGELGILVFRGPDQGEVGDWLAGPRATACAMPDGRGAVHSSFLASMAPLWDPLIALLSRKRFAVRRLLLTGHGIGGALALLSAVRLAAFCRVSLDGVSVPPLQGIHTFGQPRVGDAVFAEWAEECVGTRLYRYVCQSDRVPRLPAALSGFVHAGREYRAQAGRWQPHQVPGLSALQLWHWGHSGWRAVRSRLRGRAVLHADCAGHGAEQYLRVSRNAVNRAIVFP